MHGPRLIAMLLVVALAIGACADEAGGDGSGDLRGDAAAIDADLVSALGDDEVAELATSVNGFGFDLHAALSDGGGNTITSPLSVAVLLAMVAAGAGGDTAAQMAGVLHLDDVRDRRFGALLRRVADTDDVTLSVANSLWADAGTSLEDDYLDHARRVFGATLETAPMGEQATVERIDDWVRNRTGGRIETIAEDLGLPDPAVMLVLLNAVYFMGEWTHRFDPDDTEDRDFRLADGTTVEVPMMHRPGDPAAEVDFAVGDGYQVLRLPYGRQQRYAMDLFLPDPDRDLGDLLHRLDEREWREALTALEASEVDVSLPRFELEWDARLNQALVALGMELPFSPGADFRPMSPADPFLETVVHKTYIRVDEAGTEAAAVTGGIMAVSAPPSFTVDRPFAFTVSDTDTGLVLFLGTVEDPR